MVATFGNSKPIRRWPRKLLQKSPELKRCRVAAITERVVVSCAQGLGAAPEWACAHLGGPYVARKQRYGYNHAGFDEGNGAKPKRPRQPVVPASKADIAAQGLAKRFQLSLGLSSAERSLQGRDFDWRKMSLNKRLERPCLQ